MKLFMMKKVRSLRWFLFCIPILTLIQIVHGANDSREYSINRGLVSSAWVNKLIQYHEEGSISKAPIDYQYDRTHDYLIFETSWGRLEDAEQYQKGHIPGAIHSNSDIYENGEPRWFLRSDSEIFATMKSMGITAETTVIVYSHQPIFAARLWWILQYAGLEDVRVLDGGYEKWTADGFEGETTVNLPVAAIKEYAGPLKSEWIATMEYAAAHYKDTDHYILADVRDREEYTGLKSGYDYLIEKGRIPNSIWFYPVGGVTDRYFNTNNTFKSLEAIRAMWSELGLSDGKTPHTFKKEVIFYCGGGYRSATAFFYAYLMGYKNIRNLSNGWMGWSTTYTYDLSGDCSGGVNGTKHDAGVSKYCQQPSGREIEP